VKWWRTRHGSISDGAVGVLDDALARIVDIYQAGPGRPPTQGELADLIEFATTGALKAVCRQPDRPCSPHDTLTVQEIDRAEGPQPPADKGGAAPSVV